MERIAVLYHIEADAKCMTVHGFQDREGGQRDGQIVCLNDKTVTLRCDGQNWRAGYGLPHRLIDGNSSDRAFAPRL